MVLVMLRKIPWMLRNDLKNFQQITIKTFKPKYKEYGSYGKEDLGIIARLKVNLLKNRINVVLIKKHRFKFKKGD